MLPAPPPSRSPDRLIAAVTALVALLSLLLQAHVTAGTVTRPMDMPVWWWLAGYFTILTNVGVGVFMAATALGLRPSAAVQGGMLVAILMVGLVYHAVLARLWSPQGLAWWADQGLHSAVPLLAFGWWLGFGDRRVALRHLPGWLIWPATYAGYALVRGAATGFWPYPFLDADQLGWAQVTLNVAGLVLAFAALGLGLIGLARVSVR